MAFDQTPELSAPFRALTNAMIDGVVVIDRDGVIQWLNPAAERIFGYGAGEVIGENVGILMPEPYRGEHDDYVKRYIRTGQANIIGIGREVIGQRKDGSVFPMHLSVGEITEFAEPLFVGIVRDISAEKEAEAARRRSDALYRLLLESIPDAIWITTTDDKIVYANPAATVLLGAKDSTELVGRRNLDFVHPDYREAVSERSRMVAEGKPTPPAMTRKIRFDGELIETETSAIQVDWGERPARLMISRDMTERKRIEARLGQAEKMEAVGQLAGGAAHDFNNLLAVLMMNLEELVLRHKDDDEQQDLVQEAQGLAQSGADLTARLLSFSRQQDPAPKEVQLEGVITGTMRLLRRTIGEHIDLDTTMSSDLWPVIVDLGQLENALLNLAINARDAMPTGGKIAVEIRNVHVDENLASRIDGLKPGDYVQLDVSDTGAGIPKEIQDKIFDPFFTTKEAGSGTGLGLSMVKGFVKQSGGYLSVDSEIGFGTTFSLYLPRGLSKLDPKHNADAPPVEAPRGGETILFVEDFPQLRKRGAQMLAGLGYRVIEAKDAAEALSVLEAASPVDLLFTDLVMPGGMNGFELAKRARELRPGLKLLFASGYVEGADATLDGTGAQAIQLQKPYSRQDLARTVRRVLDVAE